MQFFKKLTFFISIFCGVFFLLEGSKTFAKSSETAKLPLPRFASLKSDEVNLRTGPGSQYPVVWKLVWSALPVEIIAEFDNWRQIRDWKDSVGWVHKGLLTGKRTVIVMETGYLLKDAPSEKSRALAYLEKGVIGLLLKTEGQWCQIKVDGSLKGWIRKSGLWGA